MANYKSDSFNTLLAAADEVEASLSAEPPTSRACDTEMQQMLSRMAESFSAQFSAATTQIATLSERVERVESVDTILRFPRRIRTETAL